MKRIALILCAALLMSTLCLYVSAGDYGKDTQKLIITHINEPATYEGAAIVYTSSSDGTIGAYGSFDWWFVVSFEWDVDDGCYKVSETDTNAGVSKSTVQIPENGFVYCLNTGNNWPEIYANDPVTYAAYANAPNYVNARVSDSVEYVLSLKKGDKAYLYGTDPINNVIINNGELWYSEGYTSDSYIKIASAEDGKSAYDPDNSIALTPQYSFGINAINTAVAEGQSMILTPDYAATITDKGNNYNWCKVAIFDWSEKDSAYVLKSLDTSEGNGVSKDAMIPPNGFALSVNTGNNYPALGDNSKPDYTNATSANVYENLPTLAIGTKVYLVGIDLKNGSFEYEGDISKYYDSSAFTTKGFIKVCEQAPVDCYKPEINLLNAPEITNTESIYTVGDIAVSWNPVDGAEKYVVCVNNSTITANGTALLKKELTETSITVSADSLTVGSELTVRVYAKGANNSASPVSEYSFLICSERAVDSIFRDKTVVAFGDSITAWTGWVAMMHGELGCEVINSGIGGDRTVHALARIEKDVIEKNPDLVIINFGMNDQALDTVTNKNLTPIDEYEANYRLIIEKIKATGSDIILVAVHDVCTAKYGDGAPKYNAVDADGVTYVDRYNAIVKSLAEEYKLGFLDINALAEDKLNEMISDGIHLSETGQAYYCEWISDYCYEYMSNKENVTDVSENENANEESGENSELTAPAESMPTWQVAIYATIMFVVISVIGVMFIKIVKKNK